MRLILVRKKLNKELEIKSFFIDEINEIDVQKGSLLSKLVLKMNNANIEFSNVENLYLDKFLELLNTQINTRPVTDLPIHNILFWYVNDVLWHLGQ